MDLAVVGQAADGQRREAERILVSGMDDVRIESAIGERIRRLRKDALMTQDDLAAAADVSTDLIRKLEQGQRHTASIGSLHHLPDFWKAIALRRMADMLRPGGVLRLWDVIYNFEPADAERRIEAWITETMSGDVERGWTRAELAEHVRDEHSTYTWLLEPMMERAGLEITEASYSESAMFARYLCTKR